MRRKDLVVGEIYVDYSQRFLRLKKKGLLFHVFEGKSDGYEWTEHLASWDIVMSGGEYWNRLRGSYDKHVKN